MNIVSVLTGFSGFMLKLGRYLRLIRPIVLHLLPDNLVGTNEAGAAAAMIDQIHTDIVEARDNFFAAEVAQVHATNALHGKEIVCHVGDSVTLSTFNCH